MSVFDYYSSPPNIVYGAFRNKIINGAMAVDQRNNGASVNNSAGRLYGVDRWSFFGSVAAKYSFQQTVGGPTGVGFYEAVTSLSTYAVGAADQFNMLTVLEANTVTDLAFGTANAKTVTLSFYGRSNVPGNYGAALTNAAGTRSYTFSFPLTNTWTLISVTIPGDTGGAWVTTGSGASLELSFSLGCGSNYVGTANQWSGNLYYQPAGCVNLVGANAATLSITGVQLEAATAMTPFEQRLYGAELALCQRYCYSIGNIGAAVFAVGWCATTTTFDCWVPFPVTMRTVPSFSAVGPATNYQIYNLGTTAVAIAIPTPATTQGVNGGVLLTSATGLTAGQGGALAGNSAAAQLTWAADY